MQEDTTALTRRNFTKLSIAALGTLPLMAFENPLNNVVPKSSEGIKVHLFSKHLQFLMYNNMAEATAEMGFDGLDLTVRPKGHVLPEHVKEDLPKAVEAMQKFGLPPRLMTTNVLDTGEQRTKNCVGNCG